MAERFSRFAQSDSGGLRDLRFAATGRGQALLRDAADADAERRPTWTAFRIAHGVAESGSDYALGDAFPHDVLLDQIGGVGFRKGCYVGQEVVSRMQHRGTARRRVLIVDGDGALPAPGTDDRGRRPQHRHARLDCRRRRGLAIVRIDRVKDAMDAGTPITRRRRAGDARDSRPGAKFTFPAGGRRGAKA